MLTQTVYHDDDGFCLTQITPGVTLQGMTVFSLNFN
jgi:hypothetical protein